MHNTRHRGFTLVELVVVIIILGVLAAVAVPRFINLGTEARVASLTSLAGAIRTTAINVHAACSLNPACDYGNSLQYLTIGGKAAMLNYGWLDAGDVLNAHQIDAWVNYSGFTASLPQDSQTLFALDGAPDPATCAVTYFDAYARGAASGIAVTLQTSGC